MRSLAGPLASAAWLRQELAAGEPDLAVVDVQCSLTDPLRGRSRYRDGHLPGAVFADMEEDLSAPKTGTNGRHPLPSTEAAAHVFGRLGIGPATTVVAYDQASGMFAARVWWMLRLLGHDDAAVLDGGLGAWEEAGGELETGDVHRPPVTFIPRPRKGLEVGLPEVEAALGTGRHLLLDAREEFRWRGEREPIDPVAGRIPGARNHPWQRDLGGGGRFLGASGLRAGFGPVRAAADGRRIVCYCGSGLTAAVNALALELAGIGPVSLYTGSWSEWCADPARPVERG